MSITSSVHSDHPEIRAGFGSSTFETGRPAARVLRRRRWWLWTAAGVLAVAAVAGQAGVVRALDTRIPVVTVARPVAWGAVVGPGDLGVAEVSAPDGVATIPAARREALVGTRAVHALQPGELMTPVAVTRQLVPGPGQQLVGLSVPAGRLPARGVRPGDVVQALPVPDSAGTSTSSSGPVSGGGAEAGGASPAPITARVAGVRVREDGATTVDVLAEPGVVAAAQRLAPGRVVVTVLGPPQS